MSEKGSAGFWEPGAYARWAAESEETRRKVAELERLWAGAEDPQERERLQELIDTLRGSVKPFGPPLDERLY